MNSDKQPRPIDLIDTFAPGKFFSTPSDRNDVLNAYRTWLRINKSLYVKYFSLLAILYLALLIPFDFLLFSDGVVYARIRVISIIVLVINLYVFSTVFAGKSGPDAKERPVFALLLPGLLLCLLYEYWFYTASPSSYSTVFTANFMVIFLATFFYHRFWREQYLLNSIAILGLILMPVFKSELLVDSILLIMFQISSMVLAFFFRRQFVGSMYVTNLKRSRQELQEAKERAEISDRLKNVFLSTISHEVRTPLNVILGYSDLLQMSLGEKISEDQTEWIKIINEGSTRLIRLMDDIIDISRIEGGKISLQKEEAIGDDLVMLALKEIKVDADKKGISVKCLCKGPEAIINVDVVRLHQALDNLLRNAVKFTNEGSITVTTTVNKSEYRIIIEDTGIGINKDFMPHLFSLFKQAEEGFSRSFEGAGLGLALSHRLIQAMNGRIKVKSREGSGSTFTVILPLHKTRELDKEQPEVVKHTAQKSLKSSGVKKGINLLVLEDNPANTKYIEFLLNKLGYDHESVDSGTEALSQIENINPDGMLIDISLSEEMDGIEFLNHVREIEQFKDTPAIAVTAHAMKGTEDEFFNHGFDDYLPKPFTIHKLEEVLEKNILNPKK